MKNYEKPVVLANNEMSEGVYAASGDTCWKVEKLELTTNTVTEQNGREVAVLARHYNMTDTHTAYPTIDIQFNQTILSAISTSGIEVVSVNGSTVTVSRNIGTANPTNDEQWGYNLVVTCAAPATLAVNGYYITCVR